MRNRRFRSLVGLGASTGVAAVAIGAFAWAMPDQGTPTGYRAYLTTSAVPETVSTVPASPREGGPTTVTTDVAGLISALSGIPDQLAAAAVASAVEDLDAPADVQVSRTMTASVDVDGAVSSSVTVHLLSDDGLAKVATVSMGGFTLTYSPPMVELPPDPLVGATWNGEGSVSGIATYAIRGSVLASDEPECIRTNTTTTLTLEGSEPFVSNQASTWCRGRGSVSAVDLDSGRTYAVVPLPPPIELPRASPRVTAGLHLPAKMPFLSSSITLPVVTTGDVLVAVNSDSQDLTAIRLAPVPDDLAEAADDVDAPLSLAWMQHPGGKVLGVVGDGQNVYVTTTLRSLMAFDRAGGLRWQVPLTDVAAGAGVVIDDVVVVALLDGTVQAYGKTDGSQRWTRVMSDAVVSAPVAAAGVAVIGDIAGHVEGLTSSGDERWSADVAAVTDPIAATPDGHVVIGDGDGIIHLFDTQGNTVWESSLPGPLLGTAVSVDGVLAIPTKAGVLGLDWLTGERRWLLMDWAEASAWPQIVDPGGVVVTDGSRLAVVSSAGEVTPIGAGVNEPQGDAAADLHVIDVPGGPLILTSSGSLLPWPRGS